jgi:hypothetical protein
LTLVKTIPLSKFMQMDKNFTLVSSKRNDIEELSSGKSDFEEFLDKMQIYTEKHLNRVERYIRLGISFW